MYNSYLTTLLGLLLAAGEITVLGSPIPRGGGGGGGGGHGGGGGGRSSSSKSSSKSSNKSTSTKSTTVAVGGTTYVSTGGSHGYHTKCSDKLNTNRKNC